MNASSQNGLKKVKLCMGISRQRISREALYRWLGEGESFPLSVLLNEKSTCAVEVEIDNRLAARLHASRPDHGDCKIEHHPHNRKITNFFDDVTDLLAGPAHKIRIEMFESYDGQKIIIFGRLPVSVRSQLKKVRARVGSLKDGGVAWDSVCAVWQVSERLQFAIPSFAMLCDILVARRSQRGMG